MSATTTDRRPSSSGGVPPVRTKKRPARRDPRKKNLFAWVLLAPTLIGMGVFTIVPIIGSLLLAFFRWDIISAPEFVGLANFADIALDPTVRVSFLNTIVFVVIAVTLQLGIALLLASLIQEKLPDWLRVFFRSTFFFPLVLSAASVSIFMGYLFNEQFGVVNWLIGLVGLAPVPWLTTPAGAAAVVIIVYVWQNFGFSFLLFVGGLGNIPKDVYEAAELDGASGLKKFINVTMPLLSPTTLVASVMAVITALQVFDQPYVLTRGGPGDSTRSAVMVVFESAFEQLEFGRASAIGLVLMLLIMAVTYVQFQLSRRFVFYQ
ncbi:sugar ABC transporter permease [Kocuria polaris]|nr:sugar ABC transporter permease [Kocuria polaris]